MKNKILTTLAYFLARLLGATYKFKYINSEYIEEAKKNSQTNSYIFALWHQGLISALFSHSHPPHLIIVSSSKDGDIITHTIEKLGHATARGSSTRGGGSALFKMIKLIKRKSYPCAITIDGPKGPKYKCKPGIIELSNVTKTPIVPLGFKYSRYWEFNSWDKFKLPKPFSEIQVIYGKPLSFFERKDFDQCCIEVENNMLKGDDGKH